jgi:uncharacterized membrane protein YccC
MFSQGQLVFAGFFVVVFTAIIIYSYRKDVKLHNVFYKGNYKILIGFLIFIALLFVIKIFLKH